MELPSDAPKGAAVSNSDHRSAAIDRRTLLWGSGAAALAIAGTVAGRRLLARREPVFIARGQRYDGSLVTTIRDGLSAVGFNHASLRGKRVLLKPNLVEPSRDAPHMTTHPAMILAAAAVFRSWDAEVVVGEAPGHVRDTEFALLESGVFDALERESLPFADLNYDDAVWVRNRGRASRLDGIWFPRTVAESDLVVSMPKMKTHHWIGVTASMKNLYGTLPGIKYGWPKNVLHFNGIPETVFDINASLPKTIAIVDAIDCMEGDGPIMGTMRSMGLVLVGKNLPAVDATVCRLMDLRPERVKYLRLASRRLGPIDDRLIEQRGEVWQPLARTFEILDKPHLAHLRDRPATLAT